MKISQLVCRSLTSEIKLKGSAEGLDGHRGWCLLASPLAVSLIFQDTWAETHLPYQLLFGHQSVETALQATILPPPQLWAHSLPHSTALTPLHAFISARNESNEIQSVDSSSPCPNRKHKQSLRCIESVTLMYNELDKLIIKCNDSTGLQSK